MSQTSNRKLRMKDFLAFRTFMTPMLIQVIFWLGVIASVVFGVFAMTDSDFGMGQGLAILVLGPVVVRIYAELLLLSFSLYNAVKDVRDKLNS